MRLRDPNGFTPVHGAAACENPHALRELLALGPSGMAEDLKSTNNRDGMTSLEALKSSMRSTKEFMETLLHKWDDYDDEGLRCEYLVQKALGGLPALVTVETEEVYIKKRKFGCMCGMCTDGWLSPRMRVRLIGNFWASERYTIINTAPFIISSSNHPTRDAPQGP